MSKRWMMLPLMAAVGLFWLAPAASATPTGPSVFRDAGCTSCHSVRAAGIALDEDGEKASDLSKIGKDHDKKWFAMLLLQKAKTPKGELHKKKWRGDKADLKVLCEWLETLDGPKPKPSE